MTTAGLLLLAAFAPQDPGLSMITEVPAVVHRDAREITVELPAIELPAHTGHHGDQAGGFPPVVRTRMPIGASLYGFRVELVDGSGNILPSGLLHHANVIDPHSRELFLPISRRLMAMGSETGPQTLPWLLFGMPMAEGQEFVVNAMLHNPSDVDYRAVTTRFVFQYVPGGRPWPFFEGHPFQIDVLFPVGDKSFPLPPGISTRSWEGRPAVAGKIAAIGGHLHDYGTRIELAEVESGKVLWTAAPALDDSGRVVGVPVGKLWGWFSLGAAISPDKTYRVTVTYDNPTGETIAEGGMGVVGGLFLPARKARWPRADKSLALYGQDAAHYLRLTAVADSAAAPAAAATDHSAHQHTPTTAPPRR